MRAWSEIAPAIGFAVRPLQFEYTAALASSSRIDASLVPSNYERMKPARLVLAEFAAAAQAATRTTISAP